MMKNTISNELILPVSVLDSGNAQNTAELLKYKGNCLSFAQMEFARLEEKGSYVLLDFGKEICGSVRILTRGCAKNSKLRLSFGESVGEALSTLGEKGACNDHSLRDFEILLPEMSDLTFGNTGFRFLKIESKTDGYIDFQNIFAVNNIPVFEKEAVIKTSDKRLNKIINTAYYTLKLCMQNGYIWDGIKRDRLVWAGDLHQEVITSLYLFGDNPNVRNSLTFLRECTPKDEWINHIPSYSAWWIINLCDYCDFTQNSAFFEENSKYAQKILSKFNSSISKKGKMNFSAGDTEYFLDWPTKGSYDAAIGTAAIIILAAKKFLGIKENKDCREIISKLEVYLRKECSFKQAKAFQILAGGEPDCKMLEKEGAKGFSTFMAYYILTADALSGGKDMLSIIKEYFGAMLDKGATTFFEDFDMDWVKGSGRIDKKPCGKLKCIHGDFGKHCYKGYRHSLCHGWSSGVLAFVSETLFGIKYDSKTKTVSINPHKTAPNFIIKMPIENKWLKVGYKNGKLDIKVPKGIAIK